MLVTAMTDTTLCEYITLNVMYTYYCLKDTQQDRTIVKAAAAATSCVCMNIHSGKLTSTEIRIPHQSTAWNISCSIQAPIATTYSLKATTVVIRYLITQRRVHFATWEVVQQLL